MKSLIAFLFIVISFSLPPSFAQIWRTDEILLNEDISDGLIEDLNRDGRNDLLLIVGNFVYIYFQKEEGFSKNPDERIYYKLLGDYIGVGEVVPSSPGLELLGVSENGVKCYRNMGSHYIESPGYLISARVDMPEYRLGPAVSNFAFDINSDGRDEIFLLQDDRIFFYHSDDSGRLISVEVEGSEKLAAVSLRSHIQTVANLPARRRKKNLFLFWPQVVDENAVLMQDFNHDGLMDIASSALRLQGPQFRFYSVNSPFIDKGAFFDRGRYKFFLDVNGDSNLDQVFLETKGILTENINVFPFAKIYIYLEKDGSFASTPDFFQKTVLVNDQSPFVDVDGDGDLDFVSVWSEITPGSKEDIIQVLLESTWNFSFRCYLFEKNKGFSLTPDLSLKAKIEQEVSRMSRDIPFDISGDFDGNGSHDLLIKKDPKSVYIYFLEFKAKKYITFVKRLDVKGGFSGYQVVDLDGNGRSDLIFFSDKGVRVFFSTAKFK